MRYQMVIAGVGGQGAIFLVKLLSFCALKKGVKFIGTETHGMAQKGGTVISYLKFGNFKAPLVGKGKADLLLGLYPSETLRFLYYLKPEGTIVTNGGEDFPQLPFKTFVVNALDLAVRGEFNLKSLNVFLLGYALASTENFPFTKEEVEEGIKEVMPKFARVNLEAFNKGYSYRR